MLIEKRIWKIVIYENYAAIAIGEKGRHLALARFLSHVYKLRRNLRLHHSSLLDRQRKSLRAIVRHAYQNVPFYHRKFDKAGIKPDDVKSVADLAKAPLTSKFEIQASTLDDVVARNVDVSRCFKRTTSGSTGVPLTIIVDRNTADFEGAVWVRTLLENELRLRDKMAVIADPRSFQQTKKRFHHLGIVRRKYVSIFDDARRQLALLEEYKPDVIRGYVSSLAILADICSSRMVALKPRLIFTGAELLDDWSRKLISSAFEAELLDNYASGEFSLLAWECREHSGYHINVDSVVMEFVDNGEAVAPGEHGEIVCTSLTNYAMPLIRYRLDDVGVPAEERCACGRSLPLMKILEGRADDFLITLDGRIVSPTVFFPYPFEDFEGIRQFRVIQEKRGKLTIQLAVKESFFNKKEVLEKARNEIWRLFGEGMQVKFQLSEKIDRDTSGKLRKTVSYVPMQEFLRKEITELEQYAH